ncbi:MAG: glycosyltransferase [Pirellulales bacterium]
MEQEFTIVVPLSDHRQQAEAAVEAWNHQDYAADRFEVVVVAGPDEETLVPDVARRLRPQDRVLRVDASFYAVQADAACRAARFPWLLLTESHVLPEPTCLSRLAAWYARHEGMYAGGSLKSYGLNANWIAECEQRLYDDDYVRRMAADHWNKVTVRGFTLSRQLYLQSGGFDLRYGHFAELLWGYELFRQGHRFTAVADAVVGHYNNDGWSSLREDLLDFGRGLGRFRVEHPLHPLQQWLPSSRVWESVQARERWRQGTVEGLVEGAGDEQPHLTGRKLQRALWRGPRWQRLAARWRQWRGRLQLATRSLSADETLRLFARVWQAMIDEGEADYFARRPAPYTAPLRRYPEEPLRNVSPAAA